jgi:pilus assembly protein CpaC
VQLDRILKLCTGIVILCSQAICADVTTASRLVVTVGKSISIDSPLTIKRISIANNTLAETVAIGPREVLLNGKAPGETSLVIWQEGDVRLTYDVLVRASSLRLEAVRKQIARECPDAAIDLTFDNDTPFLRGTVTDAISAERVVAIASTLGKTVNLLRVAIPPVEPQVLLKVRFANVDRAAAMDLGTSLASGSFNQSTGIGTGPLISQDGAKSFSLSQVMNIFLFRKDLNLGMALQALESKRLLEMLAEPNLLAINGVSAHFLAGGEFPYPTIQPGGGVNAITIAFKEFGIHLGFLPVITPRGTIRLQVSPEVSSLDYTNSVTISGTTIPGLSMRKVQTEVELDSGQSFVIAGLLDNQTSQNLSKIPGIGDIPILGKLFQSKSVKRSHTELLIIITPEIVRPIPSEQAAPEIKFTLPSMSSSSDTLLRHPGIEKTGPVPVKPPSDSMPIELLMPPKKAQPAPTPGG